jgi:inosose dehydratase
MLTRRTFLRSTTLLATAAPLPLLAAASKIDLGFSLYGMKTLPIDEALATCASIGYRNVEFALNPGFPTEPKALNTSERKRLAAKLAELKLDLSALMLNMSLAADATAQGKFREDIKEAAQLAHDLSPQKVPVVETVLGGKPAEWDQIKDRMAENLHAWATVAAEGQISLAIKAHVGSAVDSPERLLWLLQKADQHAIRAAYDYSHFQLHGIPLEESLKALLPFTKFIHVKDSIGDSKKFQFVLPGEGHTDYAAYFKYAA